VYFIGDSITRRWGATDYPAFLAHWNTTFSGWNAGNFAWGADSLQHILWRAQNGELDGVDPRVIVILAGANNISGPLDDAQVADLRLGMQLLLDTCRLKAPSAKIILMGVLPSNYPTVVSTRARINATFATLADGTTIRFLDVTNRIADANGVPRPGMLADDVHLALPGYQAWADALRPLLLELLGPPAATDHAPAPTGDPSVYRPTYTAALQPPVVPRQILAVAPATPAGRAVGTVQAIDPDGGEVGNWQIIGGTGLGLFTINAHTGQLTLATTTPAVASSYTLQIVVQNGFGLSAAGTVTVLVSGVPQKVIGCGYEFDADVHHANGNIYDQILLTGPLTTIRADADQIVRASYLDLNNDIVQIEYSGPGSVTISLTGATPPAPPVNYNQDVPYVKGHATIAIEGANEFSNLSVFSVGRGNAVNQDLFKPVTYDGVADLARVIIAGPTQRFGGLRTANADYWAVRGDTGVSAPGVRFSGPVNLHNLSAREQSVPVLVTGAIDPRAIDNQTVDGCVLIAGGDLAQVNAAPIRLGDATTVYFSRGEDSHRTAQPAQPNRGTFRRNGQDVTAAVVRGP
jgi:lysophospholipase L1-like esterase